MTPRTARILLLAFAPLASVALAVNSLAAAQSPASRTISIDLTRQKGPRDMAWRRCVGSAHAGLLGTQPNLEQLAQVHRELGMEYVRFHGILTDDMHVYSERDGKPVYDFSRVDALYDGIRAAGMRPFVELSFIPNALASGNKLAFFWKGNVSTAKDLTLWSGLIREFTRHLEQRYGADEVRRWPFEVWNEPNYEGFWATPVDQAQYFALYDATALTLKQVDPALHVGGPATAGAAWVPDFLAHTAARHVPVDFISTHTYAVSNGFLDVDGHADTILSSAADAITGDVSRVRHEINASTLPALPLEITEWSTSYSSRDPVHDAYLSAPFVLEKLKQTEGLAASMSYWTYSDLFEEAGPPPAAFHGGFGLLTRDDLKKPVYFAYRYLNQLGPTELLNADSESWVTRSDAGVQALVWNYTHPPQQTGNKTLYTRLLPAKDATPVQLSLSHLSPGTYTLELHRTGFHANDAYSAWIELGLPKDLTADQLTQLKADTTDRPESTRTIQVPGSGSFTTSIPMRENDVVFLSLHR